MEQTFVAYSEPLSFGRITEKGQEKFFAEGFISTTDRDLVNDIVTDHALDSMMEQMKSRVIKLDFEHEAFRGETDIEREINKTRMTLAKAVDFARIKNASQNGLKVRWEFNDTWKKFDTKGNVTMDFEDIKKNIQKGFYDAFSIAFIPTKDTKQETKDGTVRMLDDMRLLNVALTGNPVNPGAGMTNIFLKSLNALESKENKNQKEEKMSEEHPEKDKVEGQAQEQPAEQPAEPAEPAPEQKSESVEVKSRLDALEKSVAEIKELLTKPVQKSVSEQMPKKTEEAKSVTPLDLI